jgi:hypothetical protein
MRILEGLVAHMRATASVEFRRVCDVVDEWRSAHPFAGDAVAEVEGVREGRSR